MAEGKPYTPPDVGKPGIYREGWIDFNKNGVESPYEDPSRPVEERVEDLLSRMTLEEELNQLGFGRGVGLQGACASGGLVPGAGGWGGCG